MDEATNARVRAGRRAHTHTHTHLKFRDSTYSNNLNFLLT